jgi:hypothetical protein
MCRRNLPTINRPEFVLVLLKPIEPINSSVLAKEWVSVAAEAENITALCLTNSESNTLSVRFYNLQWDNQSEILALEAHKGGELSSRENGRWKSK